MAFGRSTANTKVEQLIAVGRIMFAACSLLALGFMPELRNGSVSLRLHYVYGIFAAFTFVVVWLFPLLAFRLRLATHATDVAFFAVLYLTENQLAGSLFVFFVFTMLSATLRWQWRGTLSTATVIMTMAVAMSIAPAALPGTAREPQLMIRGVYLALLAVLIGYFVTYELILQRAVSKFAAEVGDTPDDIDELIHDALRDAAEALDAPRVVMLWEEDELDRIHLASWDRGQYASLCEDVLDKLPLVPEALDGLDFYSEKAASERPRVVVAGEDGRFRSRRQAALNKTFIDWFKPKTVLSVRFPSANAQSGRIFWLDKRKVGADDVMVARLAVRGIVARIQHFALIKERKRSASAEERVRLARDLHDGLLQSLTAMSLKLEGWRHTLKEEPSTAEKQLPALQALVLAEQRHLRQFIELLKPGIGTARQSLGSRLQLLVERLQLEWNITVDLRWLDDHEPTLPPAMTDDVYYIVSEALVNAARHSGASVIEATVGVRGPEVFISVADNGRGFPFHGRYDDGALAARGLGPRMLTQRVHDHSGRVSVHSSALGARLDVSLPLTASNNGD